MERYLPMEAIPNSFTADALDAAWERVRAKGGAPGVDGLTVEAFGAEAAYHLGALEHDLASGTYCPQPYRTVSVQKSDGGRRRLVIATVRDRVAQRAAADAMLPLVEPCLLPCSFAYRRGIGVHEALAAVAALRDRGLTSVFRADVEAYFDSVVHETMLALLGTAGVPDALCALVKQWLTTPITVEDRLEPSLLGLPQGLPIAPLLANLYLTPFDRIMTDAGWSMVRYADDFTVCVAVPENAHAACATAMQGLAPLGLQLNASKTLHGNFEAGFSFLGAAFKGRELIAVNAHPYEADFAPPPPPRAAPPASPRVPRALLRTLYVQQQGAHVSCRAGRVVVKRSGQVLLELPLHHIDQIFIFGTVHISTPAMAMCLRRGVPISLFSGRGDYRGAIQPIDGAEFQCERAQYALLDNHERRLEASRAIVAAKIAHAARVLEGFLRNHPDDGVHEILGLLAPAGDRARASDSLESLRGVEGAAAAAFFRAYAKCFRGPIQFTHRNRRPPLDPVNSLLSFGYTIVLRHVHAALTARGLDANVGLFHNSGRGHPALASDLLEEFRAPLVDALVLSAANRRQFAPEDFHRGEGDPQPCLMRDEARTRFIDCLEQRMLETVAHPESSHRVQWRQAIDLQAQRMRRFILGETVAYVPLEWRKDME
jgi:CRISPR-associated protein Cas1